jgi:hypothetical protein
MRWPAAILPPTVLLHCMVILGRTVIPGLGKTLRAAESRQSLYCVKSLRGRPSLRCTRRVRPTVVLRFTVILRTRPILRAAKTLRLTWILAPAILRDR